MRMTSALRVFVCRLEENYEIAEGVCIPRSTLYIHYLDYCNCTDTQPVNAASFGKVLLLSSLLATSAVRHLPGTTDFRGKYHIQYSSTDFRTTRRR